MSHNAKRISTRKRAIFGGSSFTRTGREDQEEYEEQEKEGRQNCSAALRNFSNPDRPFLRCHYLQRRPYPQNSAKNPGNPPFANRYINPQNDKPWGAGRSMPTPSRATFKIIVLRYRNSGGQYHPPLSRTTPLTKKIGGLCSLRSQSLHSALKGGDIPLPEGNGMRSRKKRKHPCLRFFLSSGGIHAAPPLFRYSGS